MNSYQAISIHDAQLIEVKNVSLLKTVNVFTRTILIIDKHGSEFAITVYGKDVQALTVNFERESAEVTETIGVV